MICVIGNISITSGLIQRSKKFGFSICLMSTTFKVYEVLGARMEGNTLLRTHQYAYQDNEIGRKIEQNKIVNQRNALKKIRSKNEYVKEGVGLLNEMVEKLDATQDYLTIMGVEGNAAKVYFPRMFDCANWNGRKPRIKSDYLNVTLDIGYTMLTIYQTISYEQSLQSIFPDSDIGYNIRFFRLTIVRESLIILYRI